MSEVASFTPTYLHTIRYPCRRSLRSHRPTRYIQERVGGRYARSDLQDKYKNVSEVANSLRLICIQLGIHVGGRYARSDLQDTYKNVSEVATVAPTYKTHKLISVSVLHQVLLLHVCFLYQGDQLFWLCIHKVLFHRFLRENFYGNSGY